MNLNDDFGAITGIEGGKQSIFTAGLNRYVNTNIVFKLNYLHGIFDKQATSTTVIPGATPPKKAAGRICVADWALLHIARNSSMASCWRASDSQEAAVATV
jgi:phosphate-selective porin OprO/OprP